MRTAKSLISLGGCPGLSSLGAYAILLFCHKVAEIVEMVWLIFITEKKNIYLPFLSFSALTRNNVWKINLTSLRFFPAVVVSSSSKIHS